MKSERKPELSAASVLFMLLVIFIHVSAEAVSGYRRNSAALLLLGSANRLSSFVVQGFLFLSGLKLFLGGKNMEDFSYPRFLLSRGKRVVLPYLAAFAVFYGLYALIGWIEPSLPDFFRELFTGGLVGHFYFVVILCQFLLLTPLWRLLVRRADPALTLLVTLLIMLICQKHLPELCEILFGWKLTLNDRLCPSYLFYFVAGTFAGKYYRAFCRFLNRRRRGILVLAGIAGIIDCALIWVIRNGLYYPLWADTFHVLYCISAILAVLSLTVRLRESRWKSSELLRLADRASYAVYLIHPLFLGISVMLLNRAGIASLTVRFLFEAAFTYAVTLGLCLGWEALRERMLRQRKNQG